MATDAATGLRPGTTPGRRRTSWAWVVTLPFFVYAVAFLFVPAGSVMLGAFQDKSDNWTFGNIHLLFQSPYKDAYVTSIKISLVSAVLGGIGGFFIAYSAVRDGTPRWIRGGIMTFSGVAANFGGVPLAFAFIATLGPMGVVTAWLRDHGYDLTAHGLTLFDWKGVVLVYLYFQFPLMILVIAPAIDGLRREWREAALNLGATPLQFWRHVGIPVLMPSLLGAMILLFGNAFAAYATAYSLTAGSIPIVPNLISAYYTGNVLDNPHLAQALAFGMFCVLAAAMVVYIPLQRRSARWAK